MTNQRHISILEEIKKSGGDLDMGKPNDSVLLIDGMNTFIRVFSAIPTTNEDGIHVGGIVGFLRSLACLLYTSPSPRDKRQSRMPSSA